MSVSDDIKEQKFDAMLKPALYEQMIQEMERQEVPEEKHPFSKSFDRKMNRLIRKAEAEENRYRSVKAWAAVIVAAVVALGVLTMSVEAIRVPIWNLFMGEEYSVIDFGRKKEVIEIPEAYEAYAPGYVVTGYELVYAYEDTENCFLQYKNLDGQGYVISIYKVDTRTAFDTEEGEVSKIKIGDQDVILMEKDERRWVNFSMNHIGYIIEGNVDIVEIKKIMESIE